MSKQLINLGTGELTGDGESLRSAFTKINDNFDEVYQDIDNISIPTNISVFNNDVGYLREIDLPTAVSSLTNDVGYITTASLQWNSITGKPTFATVSTSGSYNDLTNKPAFATVSTSGSYNDLTNKPVIYQTTSSLVNGLYTIYLNTSGGLVFGNNSVQYTAWTGTVNVNNITGVDTWTGTFSVNNISGLATVSTTGSYLSLTNRPKKNINFMIDGGGVELTPGVKGYAISDITGTIDSWTILSDTTGTVVVDVKKSTYNNFPTTTSIASSDKPTLTESRKNQNSTLTVWTTSVVAGDILEFVVDSASTVTQVIINLRVSET